jgi:tetratricopeptide (TPR) repeat protein
MSKRKKIIIIIIAWVVLVAACVAVGIWYVNRSPANPGNQDPDTVVPVLDPSKFSGLAEKVQALEQKGDTEGAAAVYTEAATSTDNKVEKAYLYSSASSVYLNADKLDQSLESALDAYEAAPSEGSAALVADIYERLGDEQRAIEYYNKTIELIDPEDPTTYGSEFYQSRIDELQ